MNVASRGHGSRRAISSRPLVLAALATFFLFGSAFVLWVTPAPTATLNGQGTDHQSHFASAILFAHEGFAIFARPIRELCPTEGGECRDPNRAGGKPLYINWENYPRPYPPGALLYALPEALLYAYTPLTALAISRLSLIKLLAAALLLAWSLIYLFFDSELYVASRARSPRGTVFVLSAGATVLCLTADLVRFALFGIYDPVAVLALLWAAIFWRRGRPVDSFLCAGTGLFLHFRALWLLPLLVTAGLAALGQLRRRRAPSDLLKLGGTLCLLAGAAIALAEVAPWLSRFPDTNPLHHAFLSGLGSRAVWLTPVLLAAVALLLWNREWWICACVATQVAILIATRQVQPWHELFLIPLFALAKPSSFAKGFFALLLLYEVQAVAIFHNPIDPMMLVAQATKTWKAHRAAAP